MSSFVISLPFEKNQSWLPSRFGSFRIVGADFRDESNEPAGGGACFPVQSGMSRLLRPAGILVAVEFHADDCRVVLGGDIRLSKRSGGKGAS